MTRTSELFQVRRSRVGRGAEPVLLDHSSTEGSRYAGHTRRRRAGHSDFDSFDYPLWRSHPRPSSAYPFEGARMDQMEESGNHRLPGSVLLARARLLERLRGMSLQENRATLSTSRDSILSNETRIPDTMDRRFDNSVWELNSFLQSERVQRSQSYLPKPPGLTSSEIDLLPSEIFSTNTLSNKSPHVSSECSICLESFSIGDHLIHLPCQHRYHFNCLEPWVQERGDCPNCRQEIIKPSSSHIEDETNIST